MKSNRSCINKRRHHTETTYRYLELRKGLAMQVVIFGIYLPYTPPRHNVRTKHLSRAQGGASDATRTNLQEDQAGGRERLGRHRKALRYLGAKRNRFASST
jgi:hypothetical protein